ncbi:hypothetical protein D3C73_1647860 [compost metagenome]
MNVQSLKVALNTPPCIINLSAGRNPRMLGRIALENARRDQEKSAANGVNLSLAVVDQ